MRGNLVAVAAIAAALLLTGCTAATVDEEPATSTISAPAASAAAEAPADQPLVAQTPDPASATDSYLTEVRDRLPANTVIPNATDKQLIAAGEEGCQRMSAGESTETISLIDGEQLNVVGAYPDSAAILTSARLFLCPL